MNAPTMHLQTLFTRAAGVCCLVALAALTGCAQTPLGPPIASIDNIQAAKASGLTATAVGDFKLAPGKDPQIDKEFSIRASVVSSPYTKSFAAYLGETLRTELVAAGLFDPSSKTVIRGLLTESAVDSSASQGRGSLAARFLLIRDGQTFYDKELRVDAVWESSFIGAVAIPAARNEYTLLYRKLVGVLLTDPEFRKAVAK